MELLAYTDIGVKRSENQDNYWCALLSVQGKEAAVACLCDGMGGFTNGYLASKIVVEAVRDYLTSSADWGKVPQIIAEANREILRNAKELGKGSTVKMGTTCTVLLCCDSEYKVYHIGDSRCYRASVGGVRQLTRDHSVLQKMRDDGVTMTNDMILRYKNTLTRCLGIEKEVRIDTYSGVYVSGDLFMVCSDGLWHNLTPDSFFNGDMSSVDRLESLVDFCISQGETDNITVCVIKV